MTVLAVVDPNTLLGSELRQGLRQRRSLWSEVRLLAGDAGAEATLSELDGAALVQPLSAEQLDGVDLLFVCGPYDDASPPWAIAPPGATTVVVAPEAPPPGGSPIVSGVNLEAARPGALLVSPHPAVVLLALLLQPLRRMGLTDAVAWLTQPATMRGQGGVDELIDQTRALLAFQSDPPTAVFGHQLSFNLLPVATASAALTEELDALLDGEVTTAIEIVQGAVFHSFAASVLVRFTDDPGGEAVAAALGDEELLRTADDPAGLGPIVAAASEQIAVGLVRPAPGQAGRYWLWAVMDNLTRGGAVNALEIAAAVLPAA